MTYSGPICEQMGTYKATSPERSKVKETSTYVGLSLVQPGGWSLDFGTGIRGSRN